MQYSPKKTETPYDIIETLVDGLGMALLECGLSRHRGSVQVRLVIYSPAGVGIAECSKVHRLTQPRLELAFPGQEILMEVSSPGLDRRLKDAREFVLLKGRGVRCLRIYTADWITGVIETADEAQVTLRTVEGLIVLSYELVAKAILDYSREV